MRKATCQACSAEIVWIQTPAGRSMPCDAGLIAYKRTEGENPKAEKLVESNGVLIYGERVNNPDKADGFAYMPHWATCSAPDRFRRSKK